MKIIVGVIVLVLIMILSTFRLETKTLEQFYKGDLNDVTEIRILDGNSGYSKTVTDEKLVKAFLNKIKDIKFIPVENQEQRNGFNYAISLYVNDEATFHFR
ncbi:hypothetical protein [Bacillus litorisediminis]|uniref:hypothetical protein n=1 Tax=Bacillus litorisediminis TaxID=2922713 RepID=UPI001FADEF81|nr:hypothetical protein [Bacillus litorisediminis]